MHRLVALSLLLALPGSLPAQSHPLVGTWNVSLTSGMRIENGEETPILSQGVLEVREVGDSLVGTLTVEPRDGMPARPASRLTAKSAPGRVVFVHRGEATISTNGVESKHPVTSTYSLEAKGDVLSGSVVRAIEGIDSPMSSPQPLQGTRAKRTG